MLMEVTKNVLNCDEPDDPCTAKLLLIVLGRAPVVPTNYSSSSRATIRRATSYESWTGGRGTSPMGTLRLILDVAPIAEWTVTFVAPGDPIPTPTPTPTPAP